MPYTAKIELTKIACNDNHPDDFLVRVHENIGILAKVRYHHLAYGQKSNIGTSLLKGPAQLKSATPINDKN